MLHPRSAAVRAAPATRPTRAANIQVIESEQHFGYFLAEPVSDVLYISRAAALRQVDRIARARNMPREALRLLVNSSMQAEPQQNPGDGKVSLLALNLILDVQNIHYR
ncbi:potassium-transporting ATPase subunit C [Undibacterium terreum]|uniref:Uncharacterized protein n=1 Tax=Undibacterium terreum TaxID=1224302 RepID=A0A916V0W2_9BURK|nr:potassium-transporting ATPase subunit C [Undibacterium terreum]GGD00724.1 hypothetical protein GCM10011396_55370 [Undibacterium terreum]